MHMLHKLAVAIHCNLCGTVTFIMWLIFGSNLDEVKDREVSSKKKGTLLILLGMNLPHMMIHSTKELS